MKNRLPLRSFRLHNFKAVRDSGTVAFGPLTVFIGNNGSGKSSLVEGLETFRDIVLLGLDAAMARWRGFEHAWNQAVEHELRRPADERPHHTNPMVFRAELRLDKFAVTAEQRLNLGEGGNELFIQSEEVRFKGPQSRQTITRDTHGRRTRSGKNGRGQLIPSLRDGQSILEEIAGGHLERWQFLSLVPDAMGQPVPQQRAAGRLRLARNGANIAEYLNEIRVLNLDAFNGILDSLRYVLPFARDLQPTLASELQREFYLKLKE
jgi:predicted ATPase